MATEALKSLKQNYTLGRGMLFFARYDANGNPTDDFLYIGNSPEFNLTIETENLDHFSSDYGIREKDLSIALQVNRTGSLTTDNISKENLALFFYGDSSTVTTIAASNLTQVLTAVKEGHSYRLGATPQNPTGYFGIDPATFAVTDGSSATSATGTVTFSGTGAAGNTVTIGTTVYTLRATTVTDPYDVLIGATASDTAANLRAAVNAGAGAGTVYGTGTIANPSASAAGSAAVVNLSALTAGTAGNSVALVRVGADIAVSGATLTGGTGTAYVSGEDFELDADFGLLTVLEGSAMATEDVTVSFDVRASTRDRVLSGTKAVKGSLMYQAINPEGKQINYLMPQVEVTPNGDYSLKGEDWQVLPFTLDIQKPRVGNAIYADGNPAFA